MGITQTVNVPLEERGAQTGTHLLTLKQIQLGAGASARQLRLVHEDVRGVPFHQDKTKPFV